MAGQRKRRGKSSIARLPAEQRAFIEQLLREDCHTLDEMLAAIRERFPDEPAAEVSRSSLHRYDQGFKDMVEDMRQFDRMAQTVVGEIGDKIGEKSGALLAQSIKTLVQGVVFREKQKGDVSVHDAGKLARAAADAARVERVTLDVRRDIEAAAREKQLREQQDRLSSVVKTGALSEEAAEQVRLKILMGGP